MPNKCSRCGGTLALESLPSGDEESITLLYCLNCGARFDHVITFHQLVANVELPRAFQRMAS